MRALMLTIPVLIVNRILASIALFVYDDAFITFRYARNAASGHGLVYNVGEMVLGTTAPAYALLLAMFGAIGLPIAETATVINIAAEIAILTLTIRYVLPRDSVLGWALFGILYATSPILSRVSVGGMEMCLFLAVSVTAITLYHKGSIYAAIAIAAASYFVRPEGVVLTAVLCATELFSRRPANALKMGAVALLVVAPGLTAIYLTYGQLFSQSVMAKTVLPSPPVYAVIQQFLFPDPLTGALVLFAIPGAYWGWKNGGALRTLIVWSGVYMSLYLIARPLMWSWYGEVIYYAIVVTSSLGLSVLLARFLPHRLARMPLVVGGVAAVLSIALWAVVVARTAPHPVRANVQMPLKQWLEENTTDSTTFAAYDVGALGYYSRARITDLAGLVSSGVVEVGSHAEIVRRTRPDFLFLVAMRPNLEFMTAPDLGASYEPIRRFSAMGETGLSVEPTDYPEEWLVDYLLYRRR